jgi:ribosomal protein S18 acetylase RimI-like enzyme
VEDEKVIGFISGQVIEPFISVSSIKNIGYISAAYVKPGERGKGVGRRLEEQMVSFFKSKGIEHVEMHVMARNQKARACWKALGYTTFREQIRKKIS